MKRIKRFWFDLILPKEWNIYYLVNRALWKLKDYDRLESDYSYVLSYATCFKMSSSNNELATIYSVIDEAQSRFYYDIIKDDISKFTTVEEIKEYIDNL